MVEKKEAPEAMGGASEAASQMRDESINGGAGPGKPPEPLPVIAENIPPELRALPQWVCWRYDWRTDKKGNGKWTKPPFNPRTGRFAKSNDPATWADFDTAMKAYQGGRWAGIGFAFSDHDGLAGVDIDHAGDRATGELEPWAVEILERFRGTYAEWSPSGTGIRIFCRGTPTRCGKGTLEKRVELYARESPRYLTVTGHQL